MAYEAWLEGPAYALAEQRWAVGPTLTTTATTSCIFLVAPLSMNPGLLGVHLSLVVEGGQAFGVADAREVITLMRSNGADVELAHIFGEIGTWRPGQPPGYVALIRMLGDPGAHRFHERSGSITVTAADM